MNVWRGFTLTVWIVVMTLLAAFVMHYHAFQSTALDGKQVKSELKKSGVYENIRDTFLRDNVLSSLTSKYPDNKLLDQELVTSVLAETLPSSVLAEQLDPVVDATYRWLDSKEPEILFSVDVSNREQVLYRSLEVQLGKKVAALPSCGDYRYPPENAVLNDRCIPVYTSDEEVTELISNAVRQEGTPLGDPITSEAFTVPQEQKAFLKQIPTYLNYLWVINVVALIILGLLSLFVIASRRLTGVIAIGVSLIVAGTIVLVSAPIIGRISAPSPDGVSGLLQKVIDSYAPAFVSLSTSYGFLAIASGAGIVTLSALWIWRRRNHHAK